MKTVKTVVEIFSNNDVLLYCEKHGIYDVRSRRGNTITYYSYFGSEGFYKVTKNVKTGTETRKHLHYDAYKPPKFLSDERGSRYNYFCG